MGGWLARWESLGDYTGPKVPKILISDLKNIDLGVAIHEFGCRDVWIRISTWIPTKLKPVVRCDGVNKNW